MPRGIRVMGWLRLGPWGVCRSRTPCMVRARKERQRKRPREKDSSTPFSPLAFPVLLY